MGLIDTDYLAQQQALLPRGAAWSRAADATLTALLLAKAQEFARIDASAENLAIEANPATTTELITDWERVLGLPDPCVGQVEPTLQGRRNAIVSKLVGTGGQSIPYFISVARAMGYTITITEFRGFTAGHGVAGGGLTSGDWLYTWEVHLPTTTIIPFRAGLSCAGEPLQSWGDGMFQCRFKSLKPAHTILLFLYDEAEDALLDEDGTDLETEGGEVIDLES